MKNKLILILGFLFMFFVSVSTVNAAIGPEGSTVFNFDSQVPVTSASVAPGMYRTAQSVQLTADKSPATIYYTIDGSDPSTSSTIYDGTPINVSGDTTIKAFAVDSYGNVEAFQTFQYFINPEAPELMPAVTGPGIQLNPQLWQDKLVYKSNETGNFETYMKDLKTGVTTQLTSGGVDTHGINYDGGNLVVWNSNSQIYAYNLTDGITRQVTNVANKYFSTPQVSGDNIVFYGAEEGGDNDIYIYNYSTDTLTQLTRPFDQYDPRINGNKIIWSGYDNGNILYLYDLTTGTETKLVDNPFGDTRFLSYDIYGNKVVYNISNEIGDNSQIRVIDLTDGSDRLLSRNPFSYGSDLSIKENRVVWSDSGDIYVYDFASDMIKRVTGDPYNQERPDVYGDTVVWNDNRSGDDYDIYMAKVSFTQPDTTPPTVAFSTTVTLTANETASIYYTIDGSDPSTNSTLYTGPLNINSSTTIKYIAVDPAGNQSSIYTKIITIQAP